MRRRLGPWGLWTAAVLAVGVGLAAALRLLLPGRVLAFGFQMDPATLALLVTALAGALLLAAAAVLRRQAAQAQQALASQAAAHETERRRFIQRLDHELKNPLTAIQVQLDNLQASPQVHEQSVTDVRVQVTRLTQLTRGLRRLADLQTRPLEIETVDVDELLEEVAELLQCPSRIQLDIQRVPWSIPPLQADRELLLMVFRNLADNALKYSTGQVEIRARHTAGDLLVEVIDTGRGVPADELPLLTEELYRGSNTRDVLGSGLGLAMVQRIVERHGGRLDLRSRMGQGTIASVQLPYDGSPA
jgi:two-component system OmpR family sensor kinase